MGLFNVLIFPIKIGTDHKIATNIAEQVLKS